mmetsp:Transcript_9311/g.14082  ORF Transcript_9311/g.14082 Transcript_9311/m.14082 type:complete len:358 (+) Transcript_9311:154-1227(+)
MILFWVFHKSFHLFHNLSPTNFLFLSKHHPNKLHQYRSRLALLFKKENQAKKAKKNKNSANTSDLSSIESSLRELPPLDAVPVRGILKHLENEKCSANSSSQSLGQSSQSSIWSAYSNTDTVLTTTSSTSSISLTTGSPHTMKRISGKRTTHLVDDNAPADIVLSLSASSKKKKKKKVQFSQTIAIIPFKRAQGGSCAVPLSGGFSLGLAWETHSNTPVYTDLNLYTNHHCKRRYPNPSKKKHADETLEPLEEAARKSTLKKNSCKTSSKEYNELRGIRSSRRNVCCTCQPAKDGSCCADSSVCPCAVADIGCHIESSAHCPCTPSSCRNPAGFYHFDQSTVHKRRRNTLAKVRSET